MLTTLLLIVALATVAFFALRALPRAIQLPAAAMRRYAASLRTLDVDRLLAFHKANFGAAQMVILFDAAATPDDLTTFVRRVPQSDAFILNEILPDRYLDKNEVDFAELTQTNRTARFRAYDGRLHVSSRDAGSTKRVPLPPLSSSLSKGEYERLQLEFARNGGTNQSALAAAIYNDAEQLTREVLNRMELARGDALSDFKVTFLADNGEPLLEADFGAPAGHTVAPGVLWTAANLATMTPLQNMIDWRDVYIASRGSGPGQTLMSTTRASIVQRSAEIINAVHGSAAGRTRVTRAELNELLQSEGLPAIRTYDANVDVDGVTTRIIADDKVMFVPENAGELGYTAWGVSATALELINSNQAELDFEDAPGIVGVVEKAGPPYREFTYVDAVGLPVISNPRALLVADVA
jgi:hypothetical protein